MISPLENKVWDVDNGLSTGFGLDLKHILPSFWSKNGHVMHAPTREPEEGELGVWGNGGDVKSDSDKYGCRTTAIKGRGGGEVIKHYEACRILF